MWLTISVPLPVIVPISAQASLQILALDATPEEWYPPFRSPWLASSPHDFWNRRWHQVRVALDLQKWVTGKHGLYSHWVPGVSHLRSLFLCPLSHLRSLFLCHT